MPTDARVRVMAYMAPLIEDVDSCQQFTYSFYAELKKNTLNTEMYDEIVSEFSDCIAQIDETDDEWKIQLYNVDSIYNDDVNDELTPEQAHIANKYAVDSTINNGPDDPAYSCINVDQNISCILYFIEKCNNLSEYSFSEESYAISDDMICPIDGGYHVCMRTVFKPADVVTSDYIKSICQFTIGISTSFESIMTEYSLRQINTLDYTQLFNYKRYISNALEPTKEKFDDIGFDLSAVELVSITDSIYKYRIGLALIAPHGYYFKVSPKDDLINFGYMLVSPTEISNTNEVFIYIHRIDRDAALLVLPHKVARITLIQILDYHIPFERPLLL